MHAMRMSHEDGRSLRKFALSPVLPLGTWERRNVGRRKRGRNGKRRKWNGKDHLPTSLGRSRSRWIDRCGKKLGPLWRLGGGDASAEKVGTLLGIVLPTNLPLEEVHVVSSIAEEYSR